ncbi:uncharacterized protein LOC110699949 isoform X2 [Chenopodium quinoa]|uniref:uncharacterized protein LOC110699949 isoform X2 n=1 Tax=Chenopodium quinoa TaxID=63459 RepID=UPI000B78CA14|nr:uncharacterized protein LOC110699949 isoform X2 [Chenopodium quinoa]
MILILSAYHISHSCSFTRTRRENDDSNTLLNLNFIIFPKFSSKSKTPQFSLQYSHECHHFSKTNLSSPLNHPFSSPITTSCSCIQPWNLWIFAAGPKDWLREQKKKSIKYLLAPIDASQEILRYAYQLLMAKDVNYEQKDLEEIQGMLKSAARDCVAEDRNSLVAFQAKTGVEVCTFKLVVTNASSLLDDGDSAKFEAEARLSDLIRSFTFLNGVAKEADFQLVSDRQKVANAVMDSLSSLNNFEQGIKGCIDI